MCRKYNLNVEIFSFASNAPTSVCLWIDVCAKHAMHIKGNKCIGLQSSMATHITMIIHGPMLQPICLNGLVEHLLQLQRIPLISVLDLHFLDNYCLLVCVLFCHETLKSHDLLLCVMSTFLCHCFVLWCKNDFFPLTTLLVDSPSAGGLNFQSSFLLFGCLP